MRDDAFVLYELCRSAALSAPSTPADGSAALSVEALARSSTDLPVPSPPGLPLSGLRAALRKVMQPLRDFSSVPPALTYGVNLPTFFEGLVYFGTLTVMTKFLSENLGLGDVTAGQLVAAFSGGVTGAMFLLGELSDRWGVRRALLFAVMFMFIGRAILSSGETLHLAPRPFGALHLVSLLGMAFIIIGYGAFQPSLYCAVKHYTNKKTAAMGYALLYALQNLGAFASGLLSPPVRHFSEPFLPPNGISGVFWCYTAITGLCGLAVFIGLRRRPEDGVSQTEVAAVVARTLAAAPSAVPSAPTPPIWQRMRRWLSEHPLSEPKFSFFIFVVVPVQTLFAHAWLTMPLYIERAYRATPWVSRNFELFANLNPLLIFIMTPVVAALTPRANVYRMLIVGTAVMAAPTFLLVLGPHPMSLVLFSVLGSFGEALWQPRFLQYIAEMAPPGKTGLYMGVGQFPWFLTKVLTGMYSGWFLKHYCPASGPQNTEFMWLIYAFIACLSPLGLIVARSWANRPAPAAEVAKGVTPGVTA